MKLSKRQTQEIIKGSTILGTGGGGRLDSALSVIGKLAPPNLISFDDLNTDDIVRSGWTYQAQEYDKSNGQRPKSFATTTR